MTLADLPWLQSEQRPSGVLTYDADSVDWVDSAGESPLGEVQEVTQDAEFEVSFVIPSGTPATSETFDEAVPDLHLMYFIGVDTIPSTLVILPNAEESEAEIVVSWVGDAEPTTDGFDDARAAFSWTTEEAAEVEDWLIRTAQLARRWTAHIEATAERVEDDVAGGFTISMPFGSAEVIDGGWMATILLSTDATDDELDPQAVEELGLDGARAWTAVHTHFPSAFMMEACGYFGFSPASSS